jgi:Uma2 family endonuclease
MSAALKLDPLMTVDEFYAIPSDPTGRRWELVDGVPRAQESASDAHGTITANLTGLLQNHLRANRPDCRIVINPGIAPRMLANWNHRIPELGVTCQPKVAGARRMPDPLLLIEALSPSNASDIRGNVTLYTSVPTPIEILVVDSNRVDVFILRRVANGTWPKLPERIAAESVEWTSIELTVPIAEIYRDTHLAMAPE